MGFDGLSPHGGRGIDRLGLDGQRGFEGPVLGGA